MIAITIIEMILSIYTLDIEPGMHCILLLIMFNFTPIRLMMKAPICLALYVMWLVSYVLFCRGWEKDLDKLWRGPEESGGGGVWTFFTETLQCTLCFSIFNLFSTVLSFIVVQTYVVWVCESRLSQNLLAIKIGEAQSAIIAKRNKTNQMLLDSMLPHEITKVKDLALAVNCEQRSCVLTAALKMFLFLSPSRPTSKSFMQHITP